MELTFAGESTLESTDSDLRVPNALMNENPTKGKSSPEKPAGFNCRVEDKTPEFFSGSSKFEVSSSDLRVGTKGGGELRILFQSILEKNGWQQSPS